ncbi:hypothetical protein ACY2LX_003723 [Acinetobacter baumannii]|jgi:hypothetical protein|uniref:Uncharacterized protein n=2 Tax=Acinetobacter calcoaceticus/baumannii complex TaxID=909768 RepID=A0AAD2U7I0_ACIBA|nr:MULTISPECIES: hypothetical protein [Acinetobacter]EXS22761.1 hypothetical protein J658_2247 [Acinetobacter baumannii 573719]EHU1359367.1 hypothetical protein [Acinetobacter baumannii]EHZ6835468.1 hypothetical protein [Acinetobacter baumannii]EHZ8846211.1 hypothetical protein [Acinetobacter baumannii]EIJ5840549.1 hypothetical protein [Acinetobacter baumannii]
MNEYIKMLQEIEVKKKKLETRIAQVVGEEVDKWQSENNLAVQTIYIDLVDEQSIEGPKKNIVIGVLVDIDYKPKNILIK